MLWRKLIRDIWYYKGQVVALLVLVALGIAVFCTLYLACLNLERSGENSFGRLNAADLTAYFHSGPEGLTAAAKQIEGVRMAAGRVVEDVSLDMEAVSERITGRLISLPGPGEDPVNDLYLVRGRLFDRDEESRRGVLVSGDFAAFHDLEPGDRIHPIVNGIRQELVIQGLVISPEYLFPAPDLGELLSTAETFGVLFVSRETMAEITGAGGRINEITLALDPGADPGRVEADLRSLVSGYGYRTIVPLEDQTSYRLLRTEVDNLSVWSVMLSVLFLGAAVMVILVLLARIVQRQQSHIGLLRALGYSRGDILRYYLALCLLVGTLGAMVGAAAGYWLSLGVTDLFGQYFNLIEVTGTVHWGVVLTAVGFGIGACLLAGLRSSLQAASIEPVEAMRPPAPPAGRLFWGERRLRFMRRMPALWKFPIRNITRNPWRFIFSTAGIAVALSMLILTGSFYNLFDNAMNRYYRETLVYDARINLKGPTGWEALREIELWPEVERAEPLVELPVRYHNGHVQHEGILTGLEPGAVLYGLQDRDGQRMAVTDEGLLLSSNVQDILGVTVGDTITVEPMLEGLPARQWKVAGTVDLFVGGGGFLPVEEVRTMRGAGAPLSAVLVAAAPEGLGPLRERIRELPYVGGMMDSGEIRAQILDRLDLMYAFMAIALTFSMLLAGAIVYSMSSITTLERMRELLIFRMQGMGRRGTAFLMIAEGVLPALPGLPIGVLLGYLWSRLFVAAYSDLSDMMTIDLAIYPATIILAALGIMTAVILAQVPAIRTVGGIDLAEAAKQRE